MFDCADGFLRFNVADDCYIVESVVALPAHAIKQCKGRSMFRIEMALRELKNCDVVAELHARSLPVAQHQSQRSLEHGLVGRLVSGFLVDE